jgi:hypothetical protein
LRERFTRNFGVWREMDDGKFIAFDILFEKDTPLPAKGDPPLRRTRRYAPAHNVGYFRYLECGRVDEAGQPQGDIAPWDEIIFPFDPTLQNDNGLGEASVTRENQPGSIVEEVYSCDHNGIIEVEIADVTSRFSRRYRLRGKK